MTRKLFFKCFFMVVMPVVLLFSAWFWPERIASPIKNDAISLDQGFAQRNVQGVWRIRAENLEKGLYVLGYAMAHDRLFQMEMARRTARGTLSEVVGAKALDSDLYFRKLGLSEKASRAVSSWLLKPQNKKLAQETKAFLAGVNHYVSQISMKPHLWGPEFRSFLLQPKEFKIEDIFLVYHYMQDYFAKNWQSDIYMTQLFSLNPTEGTLLLGKTRLENEGVLAAKPVGTERSSSRRKQLPRAEQHVLEGRLSIERYLGSRLEFPQHPLQTPLQFQASNAFLCAGSRTQDGFPLLANDPHLSLDVPGMLYEAELHLKEKVHGYWLPLPPFPVIGNTEKTAWGLTYFGADLTDYYALELRPGQAEVLKRIMDSPYDPRFLGLARSLEYRWGKKWKRFKVRLAEVKVRFGQNKKIVRLETHLGPVFLVDSKVMSAPVTVQDVSLGTENQHLKTLRGVLLARSSTEVKAALVHHGAPAQNMFWASRRGETLYSVVGKVPERNWSVEDVASYWYPNITPSSHVLKYLKENSINSAFLLPPDPKFEWRRLVPISRYVMGTAEPQGCIGNGNDKPFQGAQSIQPVAHSRFAEGMRGQRIRELLAQSDKHTLDSFKKIQLDAQDNMAKHFYSALKEANGGSLWQRLAQNMNPQVLSAIDAWDFAATESNKLSKFTRALMHQWILNVKEKLSQKGRQSLEIAGTGRKRKLILRWLYLLQDKEAPLSAKELLATALNDAMMLMNQRDNIQRFVKSWSQFHAYTPRHPLSQLPVLGWLYGANPVTQPATGESVRALKASKTFTHRVDLGISHGAAMRMVAPLGKLHQTLSVHPTGTSGVPGSPWYLNTLEAYSRGQYFSLEWKSGVQAKSLFRKKQ